MKTYSTEDQARHKWCPFARIARDESLHGPAGITPRITGGVNRDALGETPNPQSCRCLASACMAWRWLGWVQEEAIPSFPSPDWEPTVTTWPQDSGAVLVGYCGLAGT